MDRMLNKRDDSAHCWESYTWLFYAPRFSRLESTSRMRFLLQFQTLIKKVESQGPSTSWAGPYPFPFREPPLIRQDSRVRAVILISFTGNKQYKEINTRMGERARSRVSLMYCRTIYIFRYK